MRYESLLAKRYIRAQKRQSGFTTVSIAVAIAVITMLFVLYGTIMDNLRTKVYDDAPYHLRIDAWPENKATVLRNEKYIKSVRFEYQKKGILNAEIMFEPGLDSPKDWLAIVADQYGVETSNACEWNKTLMTLDGIGSEAIVTRFMYFWVFLIFVLLFAFALRLMVDTAFEISSKERERHYGVLESIGATPRQIAGIITREAMRLCAVAIPIGLALGVLFAYGMYHAILSAGLAELLSGMDFQPSFLVQPQMLLISVVVGLAWTFLSAYGVGIRVVKKTPMEAITDRAKRVKGSKKNRSSGKLCKTQTFSGMLFGLPGSIAYRNARRQKKHFRITVLTLTVSITLFAVFTSVADSVENYMLQLMSDEFSYFCVTLRNDPVSGQTVFDAANALHACDLFKEVQINRWSFFETDYEETEGNGSAHIRLSFVDQVEYERIFGGSPPVSYEALANSGSFVYIPYSDDREDSKLPDWARSLRSDAEAGQITLLSKSDAKDSNSGAGRRSIDLPVSAVSAASASMVPCYPDGPAYSNNVIGTLETFMAIHDDWLGDEAGELYAELYGSELSACNKEDYLRVQSFFRSHANTMTLEIDTSSIVLNAINIMAALRAGVLLLNSIIALAALITLLNVVCTGIANRRSELASLQCVGMTDGQLLRMTLIECLQYVIKAALISAVICGLVFLCFALLIVPALMEANEDRAQLVADLVKLDAVVIVARIALASAVAFAAGCAASVAMLRAKDKQSLAEQIRSVE